MQENLPEFAIRVHYLVVGFGRQVVIDHLSLDVRRGEILGLVGASGGGKSVLMRTIIGLIPRRSGDIEVMGAMIGGANELVIGNLSNAIDIASIRISCTGDVTVMSAT